MGVAARLATDPRKSAFLAAGKHDTLNKGKSVEGLSRRLHGYSAATSLLVLWFFNRGSSAARTKLVVATLHAIVFKLSNKRKFKSINKRL